MTTIGTHAAASSLAHWTIEDLAAEAIVIDDAITHGCTEPQLFRTLWRVLDALGEKMGLGPFDIVTPEMIAEVGR